jgi:hypothetical protein
MINSQGSSKCGRKNCGGCSRCKGKNNSGSGSSYVLFGNFVLNNSTFTDHLDPGYSGTQCVLPPLIPQYRAPASGTFRNLYVRQLPSTPGGGNLIDTTYRLRVNNVATALVVVLSSSGADANIAANVSVNEGDLLDFEADHGDFGIQAPQLVVASLKFDAR